MPKIHAWAFSFFTGCAIMALEVAASRVMSPIVGSSLYTWTAIIGTVLLGLAVGAYVGGRIIDRRPVVSTASAGFFLAGASALLVVVLAPVAPALTGLPLSVPMLVLAIAVFLFLPVSLVLGALQPMIVRLSIEDIPHLGEAYGLLSAIWSVGSIAGVFLGGFFLIPSLGTTKTILLVSAILFLSGAALLRSRRIPAGAAVIMLAFLFWGAVPGLLSERVIFAKDTAYYRAVVLDVDLAKYGQSRILFLDLDTHSIERGEKTSPIYTDISRLLSRGGTEEHNVLFIGGGAYTMPNDLAASSSVTVVEVDPDVAAIAHEYFPVDPDIATVVSDARIHLRRDLGAYDLIVGDAFSSYSSVPWHLMTREFFALVAERLKPRGIYAMNIISGRAGQKGALFASVDRTIGEVFPHVERYAFGGSPDETQNIVFLASMEPLDRVVEAGKSIPVVEGSSLVFESLRIPPRTSEGRLLTDDHAPTERLLDPVTRSSLPGSIRMYRALVGG